MPLTTGSQVPSETSDRLWGAVLHALKGRVPRAHHDALVGGLPYLELERGVLRLVTPDDQARGWLREGTLTSLCDTVTALSDGACRVGVCPVDATRPLSLHLDPSHSLDSFLRSPANERAWKLVRSLAAERLPAQGPLLLAGPEGGGKSHLLDGLAQSLATRSREVLCESAESLSLRLVDALCNGGLTEFRDFILRRDALLLDGLETLAGRDGTQEELARAIQERARRGRLVVLAMRSQAGVAPSFASALRAALERGMRVDIATPEWELRVAIVMDRARRWGMDLSSEAASFVVGRLGSSTIHLDVLLTRVLSRLRAPVDLLDLGAVREALEPEPDAAERALPPTSILSLVARHFGLRIRDLRSASRSPRIATPRQIAMYLVRRHCGLSYPEIGQRFARHHTTVIHACRRAELRLSENGSTAAAIRLLEKEVDTLRNEGS